MKQQPFIGNTQFSTSPVPLTGANLGASPSFGANGQFGSTGNFSTPSNAPDPWTPVPNNTNANQTSSPWMKSGGEQANPFLS